MICFYTWASIISAYFPAVPDSYLLQSTTIRGLCVRSDLYLLFSAVSWIQDVYPGSRVDKIPNPGSGSASKNLNIYSPKNVSKLSQKWSVMFIPDPDPIFPPSRIRIQGSKKHRIPYPDPQHWFSDTGVPDTNFICRIQILFKGYIVRNNFYFLIICFHAFTFVKF
jgi:hypothetical protein